MAAGAGRGLKPVQKQKDTRLTAGTWLLWRWQPSSSSSSSAGAEKAEGPANDRRRLAKFPQFNFIILPGVRWTNEWNEGPEIADVGRGRGRHPSPSNHVDDPHPHLHRLPTHPPPRKVLFWGWLSNRRTGHGVSGLGDRESRIEDGGLRSRAGWALLF